MKWKTFLLGAAAGLVVGVITREIIDQTVNISPEKILADAKKRIKKDGKIYGSWIMMKPETYQKNEVEYDVYRGGITRHLNGVQEQFDFVADAKTGTLLELNLRAE